MRLFGLIGKTLSHSFSKKYFTNKFEKEKIDNCRYELFPISSINQLPHLIESKPDLAGLNITIPYKEAVMSYLHESHIPKGVDACNCIAIKNGKLVGYNTDVVGFEISLLKHLLPIHSKALVLGSGGASNAVCFVLKKLGVAFQVVGRVKSEKVDLIYEDITEETIKRHLLIINTTPLGMSPNTDSCPAIPYQALGGTHLLFDLVYNPVKTVFLAKGEERGATTKNGEEMLVLQAEESWKIWNS
jgi:shikimate dehydrogenase